MSEKEKIFIKNIVFAILKLNREKQNYILGIAEGMVLAKEDIASTRNKEGLQEV